MPTKPDTYHPERSDMWARHKPDYADMCPVCKVDGQRLRNIRALHRSLTDFGYSSLTLGEVTEAYDGALKGEPVEGDIIRMMVKRQMQEAGLIE